MKIAAIVIGLFLLVGLGLGLRAMRADSKAPAIGSQAHDFMLSSQESKPVSLHNFRGKWVVLYFHPKDFTAGCTIEAHNFQRDLAQ
jgi:thioredoxin-dependent peroxiredoxin